MPTVSTSAHISTITSTHTKKTMKSSLADVFGVDLRSLALLRIGVGLVCAVDALDRSWFAAQHYADSGVHPILTAMR